MRTLGPTLRADRRPWSAAGHRVFTDGKGRLGLPASRLLGEPSRRHLQAVRRVRPVEKPRHAVLDLDLAPAPENRLLQPVDKLARQRGPRRRGSDAQLRQHSLGEGHGQRRVPPLKGRVGSNLDAVQARVHGQHREVDAPFLGPLPQDGGRGGVLMDGKGRAALLDDARLVPSNLFDRVAQGKDVVDAERADARRSRPLHEIGGVILAPNARLVDGHVDALLQKYVPAQERQEAAVLGPRAEGHGVGGRRRGPQAVPDVEEVLGEEFLGDGRRVDADALADGYEVRRDEEADLAGAALGVAVLGEDGVDKGAGAAFALCAGNVDDVKAIDARRLFPSAHALEHGETISPRPGAEREDGPWADAPCIRFCRDRRPSLASTRHRAGSQPCASPQ
ncbi:hypothetical protein G6O67_008493 [Ophiocordyceps sinensis]|uniref:Uncharacterized protein n=1 Tax=Ophiocordyceps sinensis TaxID=72228 RepID=A0A8H4LSH3_9HYPO|nr:hypothetical protein G6O67_008493 [Ophiocordyceps sinensis]